MGASASRYYGAGLEFDSVREYDVGDDVRRLDWNVTARTGKLHTKVFTEDRSLNICALLSVSQTMHYSTSKLLKVEVGARFARVLFELARAQNDFFTGVVVNSSTLHVQKSSQSAAAWVRFIKLVQLASRTLEQQPSTTQRLGMMGIATSILRGSLVFVISDFLDPNELQDLKKMKTLFDIVVVRILDKAEISFESHLPINLKGHGLGGGDLNVKLGTAQASSANQCLKKANGELVEFCQREGLLLIELSTGTDDYVTPLVKALRERRGRE
jgi:uncharacterized protein (DUF58 family)